MKKKKRKIKWYSYFNPFLLLWLLVMTLAGLFIILIEDAEKTWKYLIK